MLRQRTDALRAHRGRGITCTYVQLTLRTAHACVYVQLTLRMQHIAPGQFSTPLISKPCYVQFKYTVGVPHTQHMRPAPKYTPFRPRKHAQVLWLPLFTSLAALRAVVALARSPGASIRLIQSKRYDVFVVSIITGIFTAMHAGVCPLHSLPDRSTHGRCRCMNIETSGCLKRGGGGAFCGCPVTFTRAPGVIGGDEVNPVGRREARRFLCGGGAARGRECVRVCRGAAGAATSGKEAPDMEPLRSSMLLLGGWMGCGPERREGGGR